MTKLMPSVVGVVAVLATARAAVAQVPLPSQYVPQAQLSADDTALLEQGEISDNQRTAGVVLSIFAGFGIGQAVEGRWTSTGWIFTAADSVSTGLMVSGLVEGFSSCPLGAHCNHTVNANHLLAAAGLVTIVSHAFGVADAYLAPDRHNRRVRELRTRYGLAQPARAARLMPYVSTADDRRVAGVALSF